MSASAIVKDGVVTNNGTASNTSTSTSSTSKIDDYKEQFMTLLVAQMKYQDPLEPTSNTEYISQYAQFTEVEQMQNLADTVALNRASDMVGKTVQITETDDDGNSKIAAEGKVDYVTYVSGEAYVNIKGTAYSVDKVTAVLDSTYTSNVTCADNIKTALSKLPDVDECTLKADQTNLEALITNYNGISGDVTQFLTTAQISSIKAYAEKYAALIKEASAATTDTTVTDTTEKAEATEQT